MYEGQLKAASGQSPASAPERDVGEIERVHNQVKNAIDYMESRLDILAVRLAPVRTSHPRATDDCDESGVCSPLAISLTADRNRINRVSKLVDVLLDELAL